MADYDTNPTLQFAYPTRKSVLNSTSIYQQGLRKEFSDKISGTQVAELRAPADVYLILQNMIQQAMYQSDGATAAAAANDKLTKYLSSYTGQI